MIDLIDMLDALDTALSTEEELAIQQPLFAVFSSKRPDTNWNSIVQTCDRILASLEATHFTEDITVD